MVDTKNYVGLCKDYVRLHNALVDVYNQLGLTLTVPEAEAQNQDAYVLRSNGDIVCDVIEIPYLATWMRNNPAPSIACIPEEGAPGGGC